MNKIFITTAVFALMVGVAHAGEGNDDPFADRTAHSVIANQVVSDTGSESTPTYGRGVTVLTQGDVLPTNGNAIVQTANSLPSGFENGTVAYAQADLPSEHVGMALLRYWHVTPSLRLSG